jgi:heme/copper-type cytochrome/quinol oxidase subunit 1
MNIITTLVNMRAPGLGFHRLPLFAWAMLLQSIIIILCIPVLAGVLQCACFILLLHCWWALLARARQRTGRLSYS